MKIDCGMIADLLPLYIDGACSPESVAGIEEHLLECERCTQIHREMIQAQPTEAIAADSRKILGRHRRRSWKRAVAGVLIGILLAIGIFALSIRYAVPVVSDVIYRGTAAYAVVEIGPSKDYAMEDIEAAARVVRRQFGMEYQRSVLLTLTYDENHSRQWSATTSSMSEKSYDEVIVLYGSIFIGSKADASGAPLGTIKEGWSWYLARNAGSDKWTIIGQGYA